MISHLSICHWLLILVNISLICSMFILINMKWNELPEKIPSHFNLKGEIDRTSGKIVIFTLPCASIIVTFVTISTLLIPDTLIKIQGYRLQDLPLEIKNKVMTVNTYFVAILTFILNIFLLYIEICTVNIKNLNVYVIVIFLTSLFLCILGLFISTKKYTKPINHSEKKE